MEGSDMRAFDRLPCLILAFSLVALIFSGMVAPPATTAEAAPSPLLLPFSDGETWYVCQGYFGTISHQNAYALDLTVRSSDVGTNGCWAGDGNVNASAGRSVLAPASGTVAHVNSDLVCLSFDAGGSMLIGHLTGRAAAGRVGQNARLGQTAFASTASNGGFAHIHVQAHPGAGCAASGSSIPLDDAHSMRLQGAPNLPNVGGANQHRGVALTRSGGSSGPGSCPVGQFRAEYFNNRYLSGNPVLVRCEGVPGYDWGWGGPGNGVPNDNFSVRWTGTFSFEGAEYRFMLTGDDGVRLDVDGARLIDAYRDQPPTEYAATRTMSAGNHQLRLEFYENGGGAVAKLRWEKNSQQTNPGPGSCPTGQFRAEYFNNRYLSGNPVFVRCEGVPNYDWGGGGPGNGVPNDNFSVRWTGTFGFDSAEYRFILTGDDGIRLDVDGSRLIDAWRDQAPTEYAGTRFLSGGNHQLRMEFYENGGGAVARLRWEKVGPTPNPGPPPSQGRSEVTVDDRSGEFTRGGAYWWEASIGYGSHMFYTFVNGSAVDSWGEWRAHLAGGRYEVYVFIPSNHATTRQAKYQVFHQGGTAERWINQNEVYDDWRSLGTYDFSAGSDRRVRLTDATGESATSYLKVGFDAVKFVPR
jgi:hypothetical protein